MSHAAMSSMHNSVQKQGKALKRFLQGKDRGKKVNLRPRQQTVDTPDGAAGALIGTDITRDALVRLVNKEILEKPAEQEILFICSVQKAKSSKYNIGGLVGAGSGDRNRFLVAAFEVGSKPRLGLGESSSGHEAQLGSELFVVVYYITVSQGPEYQVSLKNDLYLNDLASVEYGSGTDFTLTFDQTTPLPFAAATTAARDEIVWNMLTICDLLCQGHPETRSVDLHGLSLTATTQNFMQRNEVLGRYMTAVMEQNNKGGGLARNPAMGGLMDPSFLISSGDDEVETMLNAFKWPEQTVDDIDAQLNEHLKRLERETIDVLLSWETTHRDGGASLSTSLADGPEGSEGYLSTLQLVQMLDDMSVELESMEQWLSRNGDALSLMQKDMLEIEQENNRLDRQWKNYQRLNGVLKPLLSELRLDPEAEKILRNPARHLEPLPEAQGGGVSSDLMELLVNAARKVRRAMSLLEGNGSASEDDGGPSVFDKDVMGRSAPSRSTAPQPQPPAPTGLSSIPKRLLIMRGLKAQAELLGSVRDDFVDKASKQLCSVFGRLLKPESLPGLSEKKELVGGLGGGKDAGGRPSVVLTGQVLLNYQRQLHTRFLDFAPAIEVMVQLIPDSTSGPALLDDLLKAYADAGNASFYKPLQKAYFNQLGFRMGGPGHSASTHATLSSLPRAFINDTTPPPSLDGGDHMTTSAAIGQALAHFLPVVKREQLFVSELFKLQPDELDEDHQRLETVLLMEFEKLRERLSERAEDAEQADPFEGLAILTVMAQTLAPAASSSSSPQPGAAGSSSSSSDDRFMSELLLDLQMSLSTKFNKFVQEQDLWVQHFSAESKRAGVLAPFAKFPSFVDRLHQAVRGRPIEIANAALQKLCTSLLAWLEKTALKDPKYADVVRLENYHYFSVTMAMRQQRLQASSALKPYIDQAESCFEAAVGRYLVWMAEYQFPQLTAFFHKLEDLIVKVGTSDVQIHVSRPQLQKMMEQNSRKAITEGLQNAHRRLRKHISDDSGLFMPLWDRLTTLLFQRFSRYEEIASACYDVKLEPPPAVIRQLAQECRSLTTSTK